MPSIRAEVDLLAGSSRTEQPQAEPGQCAPGRHSIISEPPWRASSSEQQVRAGRLDFGAERMAHVNRQSVCSVEPALWADSWQRVSAGVVRRAACRSEIPSMFAVRMRVGHSQRELSSTCIEPSDERMGSVAGRTARSLRSPRAAIGESDREPRRRSDEACVRSLTQADKDAAHTLHGNRRPVERCEQPDRPVETRKRGRGRTGRSEDFITGLTPGSAHCIGKPRARGGHRADQIA